jgi:anaerobic magnesium-protoporphyrin IX monomethyl ester cyclase
MSGCFEKFLQQMNYVVSASAQRQWRFTVRFLWRNKLKEMRPDCVIILGGVHVTSNTEDALSFSEFDYGVIGEGEITCYELMECLYEKSELKDVKGIAYRTANGELIKTASRPLIEDLDSLPFPAYNLVEDLSIYKPRIFEHHEMPLVTFISSRGCTGRCTFCDNSVFGRTYRQRSAENVVAELKYLYDRYHFKSVHFWDDTFLIDKNRIRKIFELLEKENICFQWYCLSRINNVDYEFLKFIYEHGCHSIHFGVESGDPEILKIIKKGISLEKAEEVFRDCRKIGLPSTGFIYDRASRGND